VPDIDLDAAEPLSGLASMHDLSFTLLIAPTSAEDRIARIASLCTGFIYVLARVGITGEGAQLDLDALAKRIARIRSHTSLPLAVGFGVSRREHVQAIARIADAAIVGSALVRRMDQPDAPKAAHAAAALVRDLAAGLTKSQD
jgi:tryptophan synthase alpha subunit